MAKVYLATRLEKEDFNKIQRLVNDTKLERSDVARRLILIGLKTINNPEDLVKI